MEAVKAEPVGDFFREKPKPPRNQSASSGIGVEGRQKCARARHQRYARVVKRVQRRYRQSGQHGNTLAQGRFETQFAAHGALRDVDHFFLHAELDRQFVQTFLLDNGAFHIGDQKLLAARASGHEINVDRRALQTGTQRCFQSFAGFGQLKLNGFSIAQHI